MVHATSRFLLLFLAHPVHGLYSHPSDDSDTLIGSLRQKTKALKNEIAPDLFPNQLQKIMDAEPEVIELQNDPEGYCTQADIVSYLSEVVEMEVDQINNAMSNTNMHQAVVEIKKYMSESDQKMTDREVLSHIMKPKESVAVKMHPEDVSLGDDCGNAVVDVAVESFFLLFCLFQLGPAASRAAAQIVGRQLGGATFRAAVVGVVNGAGDNLARAASQIIKEGIAAIGTTGIIDAINDSVSWWEWILVGAGILLQVAAAAASGAASIALQILGKALSLTTFGLAVDSVVDSCNEPAPGPAPGPAPPTRVERFESGRQRNLCMTAPSSFKNGEKITVTGCNSSSRQRWVLIDNRIRSQANQRKCIDIRNPSSARNGREIVIWDCNGGTTGGQQWSYSSRHIRSRTKNRCIDIKNEDAKSGNYLVLWDCGSGTTQDWW